jgi:hypothetical protein
MHRTTPHRIKKRGQRLVMCKLVVEIYRTAFNNYMPGANYGRRLEALCLGMCVGIGDYENKPFTASKIAAYMGLPRATTMRRLAELQRKKIVKRIGRCYCLVDETFNGEVGMRNYARMHALFMKAFREMSELDTLDDDNKSDAA